MIRNHKQAVLDRLREDNVLTAVTFDGFVEDAPERYCVVYADSGQRSTERITGLQSRSDFEYTIHSVGATVDQAQRIAERVYAQLMGFRPSVTSRQCWPITAQASQPVRRDEDSPVPVFFGVDVFRLSSTPA